MEKFDELLQKLNELKIIQKSMTWEEDIPEDIWKEYFMSNIKVLTCNLNPDTHRWYELSTSVISIYDRFLGVESITNLFSESSSPEDCYVTLKFFEMKEIQITSYQIKQINN